MSNTPSDSICVVIHLVEFRNLNLSSSITAPVYLVLLDVPPSLCLHLSFVVFVSLRLNGDDIRTAPRKSKKKKNRTGAVDWKFALCLSEK